MYFSLFSLLLSFSALLILQATKILIPKLQEPLEDLSLISSHLEQCYWGKQQVVKILSTETKTTYSNFVCTSFS